MKTAQLKDLYIKLLKHKRGLFFGFCCLYFISSYRTLSTVAKLEEAGSVLNSGLIETHQIWTLGWFILFVFSYWKRLKSLHRICIFILFTTILYGIRLTHSYLFQDDWYHTLAVTRLNWSGLWIPFVDHITPVWRLLQWSLLRVFGGLGYMKILPYFGVLGMVVLAEILYRLLLDKARGIAFLVALAFLTFPGYAAILFWISTDAITFSAIFGLLGFWVQNQIKKENQTKTLVLMTALFTLSHLTWTTGLVFPIFSVGWFILRDYDLKNKFRIVQRHHWPLIVPGVVTLIIFYIIRKTVFSIYDEATVTQLLWVANGTTHGHEPNILRPIVWPFIAIFEGTIVRGIFGKIFVDANFFELVVRGVLFAAIFIFASWKNIKIIKSHLITYSFLFISFAVVFMGRGIGPISQKTPQGYVDFAIANDWYRISGLAGALFLWGLGFHYYGKKARRYIRLVFSFLIIPIFLGFFGITGQFRDHFIRILGSEVSKNYEAAQCLDQVELSPQDWFYASEFVMAPMFRSNPGNFWLSYEPSWFDLLVRPHGTADNRSTQFDETRYLKILSAIKGQCNAFLEDQKKYSLRSDFPMLEWNSSAMPLKFDGQKKGRDLFLNINVNQLAERDLRLFNLIVFKFKVSEPFKLNGFEVNGKSFSTDFLNSNQPSNSFFYVTIDNRAILEMEIPGTQLKFVFRNLNAELDEVKAIALPKSTYYLNSFK